jgi:hypothetical protein
MVKFTNEIKENTGRLNIMTEQQRKWYAEYPNYQKVGGKNTHLL